MRDDCCTLQKLQRGEEGNALYASVVIVLYVDDMMWADDAEDEKLIARMLTELEVGEKFFLPPGDDVEFLGTALNQDKRGALVYT